MRKMRGIGAAILIISTLLTSLQNSIVYAKDRENVSYINMPNTANWTPYYNHLITEADKSDLDVVSPNFFKLVIKDGKEVVVNNTIDPVFINTMHNKNLRVVPFINNDWTNNLALNNIDANVEQLVSYVSEYGLDGINVDLENIKYEYKDRLTEFVQKLRNSLPLDKQVTVAVAAFSKDVPSQWKKTYDYKKIAEALTGPNDYIVLMAYDEYWPSSGPVARYSFVEYAINYAINQGVSNEKIVLGIPLYGVIWRNTDEKTAHLPLWKILGDPNNPNSKSIIETFNPKITYVDTIPVAEFEVKEDTSFEINSSYKLTKGKYKVWYDDESSIKAKLSLVQKYDLKGASTWSLIQEYTPMWNYFNTWLNGEYGPSAGGNDMLSGEVLTPGKMIKSKNGTYSLVYQGDGNLVLYKKESNGGSRALWASNTYGKPGAVCNMQYDGRLVIFDQNGKILWATNTFGHTGSRLYVQDDGNVVIYNANNKPIWATNTVESNSSKETVAQGNDMLPGEVLKPGTIITSKNGIYSLVYQGDGNLVLYKKDANGKNRALWASNTYGKPGVVCIMQGDGNLVIYDKNSKPIWATGTYGNSGSRLYVQDDGNVVIYNANNKPIWATHTVGK